MDSINRLSVLAATVICAACSTPTTPASNIEVSVPATAFERVGTLPVANIPFTVTNQASTSVFLARCGGRVMATVDKLTGDTWTQYSGDACTATQSQALFELPPGSSVDAVRAVPDAGKFRLRIVTGPAYNTPNLWSITSEDFEIR